MVQKPFSSYFPLECLHSALELENGFKCSIFAPGQNFFYEVYDVARAVPNTLRPISEVLLIEFAYLYGKVQLFKKKFFNGSDAIFKVFSFRMLTMSGI